METEIYTSTNFIETSDVIGNSTTLVMRQKLTARSIQQTSIEHRMASKPYFQLYEHPFQHFLDPWPSTKLINTESARNLLQLARFVSRCLMNTETLRGIKPEAGAKNVRQYHSTTQEQKIFMTLKQSRARMKSMLQFDTLKKKSASSCRRTPD